MATNIVSTPDLKSMYSSIPTANNKAPNLPLVQPQQVNQNLNIDPDSQANLRNIYAPQSVTSPNAQQGTTQAVKPMAPLPQAQQNNMNSQVLQKAQDQVLQSNQQAISPMIQQRTQELLQDPTMGYSGQAYKQSQMDSFNRQASAAQEAARQQLADTSQAGFLQNDYLRNALNINQQRSDLSANLDEQDYERKLKAMSTALAEGRATEKQQSDIQAQGIDNLIKVRGAAEGEENRALTREENSLDRGLKLLMQSNDIEGQKTLTELQGKIDTGKLLTQQDFQASQAAIDRQLQQALAQGNWDNAIQLQQLKGELDARAQAAQNDFSRAERVATQGWQTSERLSDNDFNLAMQALDYKNQVALQNNDFANQRVLQQDQAALQLKMQTQDMEHDEKMAYLNSQLTEARANNDVDRQKQILNFTHSQEMETLRTEQEYNQANMYLQNELQIALQNNDTANQETLVKLQAQLQSEENTKNRAIEEAKVELQKLGMSYDAIAAQVESGLLDPQTAIEQIQQMTQGSGITVKAADPDAAKIAIQKDYEMQQYQYGLSHAGDSRLVNADGTLTAEGAKQFNSYVNDSVYGSSTYMQYLDGTKSYQELVKQTDSYDYQELLSKSYAFDPNAYYIGGKNHDVRFSNNVPQPKTYFTYDGKLYYSVGGKSVSGGAEYFDVVDLSTGNNVKFFVKGPRS